MTAFLHYAFYSLRACMQALSTLKLKECLHCTLREYLDLLYFG